MKAWIVREIGYEGYCKIVFAETRGKAKSEGASLMDREYMEVEAAREKKYDKYAERGGVPATILIEDGWWWTCHGGCGKLIYQDNIDNNGAEIIKGSPYCSQCIIDMGGVTNAS